jgi:hypothetical protein
MSLKSFVMSYPISPSLTGNLQAVLFKTERIDGGFATAFMGGG